MEVIVEKVGSSRFFSLWETIFTKEKLLALVLGGFLYKVFLKICLIES